VDHAISARRPDIVIVDKVSSVITMIDISFPADKHLAAKEEEKPTKYQDLRIEPERLWQKKTVMVPVVIGALGIIFGPLDIESLNIYLFAEDCFINNCFYFKKTLRVWVILQVVVYITSLYIFANACPCDFT